MKIRRATYVIFTLFILSFAGFWFIKKFNFSRSYSVGQKIDSLNGVIVFHNGGVDNVSGRNTAADGYNFGLKYQCVEFVKRYYYEHLNHKMPDSYGHAKDFFANSLADGEINLKRNLIQYRNPGLTKPKVDGLLIFDGSMFNQYGHVAIISKVTDMEIEIVQQNPGPLGKSRETIALENTNGTWVIKNKRVLGWLSKD